jgi:chemotaxis-related protein WspB
MLLTLFSIGGARYALNAVQIVEILPCVEVRPIPRATPAVTGIVNYRGATALVIDLNQLAGQPPAPALLSTRLLIVRHAQTDLGLLATRVTETLRVDPKQFIPHRTPSQPAWLGPLFPHGQSFIQRLEIEPLFREIGAAA